MKVDKYKARADFYSEDDEDHLSVTYDNRGEPFSQGITLELSSFNDSFSYIYLEKYEALKLAKLITDLYGSDK